MTHGPDDILELIFFPDGKAQLRAVSDPDDDDDDGTLVWASDDDLQFKDKLSVDFLNVDEHAEAVLSYLIDQNVIDEDEAAYVDILEDFEEDMTTAPHVDDPAEPTE